MIKQEYFQTMKEICQEADKIIRPYLEGIVEDAKILPESRLGKGRLRDLAIRLGYEISGGKDWKEVVPICASFELLNCSTYVINWIFDQKGGPKTNGEINNLIIGGFQLREIAEQVLREKGLEGITSSIDKINKAVYEGQNLDLNVLTLKNYGAFSSFSKFSDIYEKRCGGLCGEFFAQGLLVGSKVSGNENPILYEVGEILGSGLQASNDLGDFALPDEPISVSEKPYKDQLSDLRRGKLTLPIYLLAEKLGIDNEVLTGEFPEETVRLLHSTGSFERCLSYLKTKKQKAKKKLYEVFEKSDSRDLLASAFVILTSNKFVTSLKNDRG